ncbi:MAG: CPBP family intramembrane metalloprotease [Oscillospiraceae bacterium]|jgi:membrane protease YdiL (CAAX protease family)|nr:CPBP family intramembrane metalloprotease [Oscillospiraceae bacterium]
MNSEARLTKGERIAGFIYLPIHMFVFPLFIGLIVVYLAALLFPERELPSGELGDVFFNLIYYAIGFVFCLAAMGKFLRRAFDVLLDNIRSCLVTICSSYMMMYAMNFVIAMVMLIIMGMDYLVNPNNEFVSELTNTSGGMMVAISVFLGPMVEEILFRGVLFGSIRQRSRVWAYIVSIAVFGVYHVWQYAFFGWEWWLLLINAARYIPIGWALARCFDKTGSIWAPIFMHMLNNAIAMIIL